MWPSAVTARPPSSVSGPEVVTSLPPVAKRRVQVPVGAQPGDEQRGRRVDGDRGRAEQDAARRPARPGPRGSRRPGR